MLAGDRPLLGLAGVGAKTAERLAAAGLRRLEDLLLFAPRRYDDAGALQPIAAVSPGARVYVRGRVRRAAVRRFFRRATLEVEIADEGASIVLRWFHFRGGVPERFAIGAEIYAGGLARRGKRGLELIQPTAEAGQAHRASLRPRYVRIPGVPSRTIERLCALTVQAEHAEPLGVPPDLPTLIDTARALHALPPQPEGGDRAQLVSGASPAHRRLAWEGLLLLRLAAHRGAGVRGLAPVIRGDPTPFLARQRFAPTRAQRRAAQEIADELGSARPMRRLLTGDVGSGKTLVAAAAIELCVAGGLRAAFLAPTAILAQQQSDQLRALLGPEHRIALLHAGIKKAERQRLALALADPRGPVDVVVGTHALLDDALTIADLALVVIDEQQRFGVAARGKLGHTAASRGRTPHQLSLSATPIPRTLAMALRGDVAVSHLHERPPGRASAATVLSTGPDALAAALDEVRNELARGGKVYWVCPQIDDEGSTDRGVLEVERWLRDELEPEITVACCHGRQTPKARLEALRSFRDRDRVLVATSVVEVGVDVPEATLMVIESPQRFGLSQLHQLRGRVGRGARTGRCWLVAPGLGERDAVRLQRLVETEDGLAIAEADLVLRGMGDLAGAAQSGMPALPPLDAEAMRTLTDAADRAAMEILAQDPALEAAGHRRLRLRLGVGADLLANGFVVDAGA